MTKSDVTEELQNPENEQLNLLFHISLVIQ